MSPIRTADDGIVFWCTSCGAEAQRTRDEPYPEIEHKLGCPEDEEFQCRYMSTDARPGMSGKKYERSLARRSRKETVRLARERKVQKFEG